MSDISFDTRLQEMAIAVWIMTQRSCRHECFSEGPKARVLDVARMHVGVELFIDGTQVI